MGGGAGGRGQKRERERRRTRYGLVESSVLTRLADRSADMREGGGGRMKVGVKEKEAGSD